MANIGTQMNHTGTFNKNLRSSKPGHPNPVVMVLSAMLTALVAIVFARLAYGLILPSMRVDLGLSFHQAGNLGTITSFGYLLLVLPGGVAAARWGPRKAVLGGLTLLTMGLAGLAFASNHGVVMALMFLLGTGTAFCFAPMLSLLATWYPRRRGLVIGFMTAGVGAGLFLAGILVPWLTGLFGDNGWRVVWGVFACVAAAVAVLVLLKVSDPPPQQGDGDERPPASEQWRIYRNGRVLIAGMVYGIIGMVYIIQGLFMVSFAEASGISSTTAGWLFAMSGLLSVLFGPLWGLLSDSWGRPITLLLCMTLVTVGMAIPLVSQTLPMFFLHFFLFGIAITGAFTMIQATSTDQVGQRYIPIAFSYVTIFFAFGQFLGPAVAGWLIQVEGFEAAVAFTCAMLLLGLYLSSRIRRFPKGLAIE
jgi:MFS family permease